MREQLFSSTRSLPTPSFSGSPSMNDFCMSDSTQDGRRFPLWVHMQHRQHKRNKRQPASTAPYKQYSMTFQGMMSLRWWEASMQEFCRRRVMGQHAVGDIKRLVSLCYVKENELIIGCSLNLDISRWKRQKPDRTHYNKQQMEALSTGCTIITPDRHR